MRLYALLCNALRSAIEAVSVGSSMEEIKSAVLEVISDEKVPWVRVNANLHITVETMDTRGVRINDNNTDGQALHTRFFRYVSLQLCHIPSIDHHGTDLGALLVGDTIVCASLPGRMISYHVNQPINLTSSIGYFNAWASSGIEEVKVRYDSKYLSILK
jgi:hypothetical protein